MHAFMEVSKSKTAQALQLLGCGPIRCQEEHQSQFFSLEWVTRFTRRECRVMEPPSQGPVPASSETLVASLSHTPLGIQLVSKGVDCRSMPTISKHRSSLDTQYVFMVSWPRVRSKQGLTMAKWTCRDPKPFPAGLRQRAQ